MSDPGKYANIHKGLVTSLSCQQDWVDKEHPFKEADPSANEHSDAEDAWFNWFESESPVLDPQLLTLT
jgi:hypothetical protein